VVENNHFEDLSRYGVRVSGASAGLVLRDNVFSGITTKQRQFLNYPGAGLLVEGLDEQGFPHVTRARGNVFSNNDLGIQYQSPIPLPEDFETPDFGTADDPGNNTFSCNASPAGGDVVLDVTGSGASAFDFAGNFWDHSPPSVAFNTTKEDIDLSVPGSVLVTQEPASTTPNGCR
jgi:hypothetical protein